MFPKYKLLLFEYDSNKNVYMTIVTYKVYLKKLDIKRAKRNIIIFMNN